MSTERTYQGGTAELLRPSDGVANDTESDFTIGAASEPRTYNDDLPLLSENQASDYRSRWEACQRDFVDEPQHSVQEADQLVADLIRDLASEFSTARGALEEQWSRGEEVSTDDLRYGFQRYRSFFNRLLSV